MVSELCAHKWICNLYCLYLSFRNILTEHGELNLLFDLCKVFVKNWSSMIFPVFLHTVATCSCSPSYIGTMEYSMFVSITTLLLK